jgi:O-antigen/teichoic acid export membrane protein
VRDLLRLDGVSRPALWLVIGRGAGFAAAFVVPLVLVRLFDQTTFGTYKQLFLIYATFHGVAQLGVAESLYYFIPRSPGEAGRHALNAAVTLTVAGIACMLLLAVAADSIAVWLKNPALASTLLPLGVFLALMLMSALFEIVLVSRKQYRTAAYTYAASDIARALFIVVPAMALGGQQGGLQGALWGAVVFAALRVVAMLWSLWGNFGSELRPSLPLWQSQLVYTLPFALAVGLEVVQANVHQYVVAARFDAAAFAIYAVGCLQVPLVDVLTTSAANIMMVKMAEDGFDSRGPAALALWHGTIVRLALVIVPLTVFLLVMARDIIVALFTSDYLASVPIFMVWTLTNVLAVPVVDSVLRAQAQTRFLVGLSLLRLALVVGLTAWFLSMFGLSGAVLVVLLSTAIARVAGVVRIARLFEVGPGAALPWKRLTTTVVYALLAAVPTLWFSQAASLPRLLVLLCAAGLYGATYIVLCYGLGRGPISATPVPALGDVSP